MWYVLLELYLVFFVSLFLSPLPPLPPPLSLSFSLSLSPGPEANLGFWQQLATTLEDFLFIPMYVSNYTQDVEHFQFFFSSSSSFFPTYMYLTFSLFAAVLKAEK